MVLLLSTPTALIQYEQQFSVRKDASKFLCPAVDDARLNDDAVRRFHIIKKKL